MRLFRRKSATPEAPRPKLEVRTADTRDLDAIVSLLEELVRDRLPRGGKTRYLRSIRDEQRLKLVDPDCVWYVATRGKEVVGCARATVHPEHPLLAYLERRDYGYVYGLFVREEERGHGAGRLLLTACESWLKKRGVKWLFLHSTPEAMDFYDARGYEPCLEYGKRL